MRVAELASELKEVVDVKAVEPESWLARGALVTLMVVDPATPSVDAGTIEVVFVQRMGACTARSPFAGCSGGDQSARRGAAHSQANVEVGLLNRAYAWKRQQRLRARRSRLMTNCDQPIHPDRGSRLGWSSIRVKTEINTRISLVGVRLSLAEATVAVALGALRRSSGATNSISGRR